MSHAPSTPSRPDPVARAHALADDALALHTPELVELRLPLAGAGSRLLALLWDALVVTLVLLALLLAQLFATGVGLGALSTPLLVIAVFALWWGYGFWFEWRRDGQTPGKRRLGLRVVQHDGRGLTARAAAVRNLLRIVDLQPGASGLVGLLLVLTTARHQRVGDLAAGTVVVRDLPAELPVPDAAPEHPAGRAASGPPRVPDALFAALQRHAASDGLRPTARARLDELLTERLHPHLERARDETAGAFLRRAHAEESARRAARAASRGAGAALASRQLARRRDEWAAFQDETRRLRRSGGLARLDGRQVRAFAARHRAVSADLARARTYGADPRVLWVLQRTLASAHMLLHRASLGGAREHPLLHGFPRLVRRHRRVLGLAALLLFGSGAISYLCVRLDPALETRLAGHVIVERAEEAAERWATGRGYVDIDLEQGPLASAGLFSNNVNVALMCFAGGILAGLGTVAILLLNGVLLGAVFATFANRDVLHVLTDFVLPHGVTELTAIVFAGGAGLHLGAALVDPGRRERWGLLAERARDVVGLLLGVIAMLAVAALVEAYVSPSTALPFAAKAAFSAGTAVALLTWLGLGGRRPLTAGAGA